MGFRINTNIAAMNAHRNATQTNLGLDKSLNSLSSGLRINKAADDASGMTIADSLRSQANGLGQAIRNANDGIAVVQTADGALDEYINIVDRVRTLSIQAASDGQNDESRQAIQRDITALLGEADNIASTTSFNGLNLLDGTFTDKNFQIGAYANETVSVNIDSARIASTGNMTVSVGANVSAGSTDANLAINGDTVAVTAVSNTGSGGANLVAAAINTATSTVEAVGINSVDSGAIVGGTLATGDIVINGIDVRATAVSAGDTTGALEASINAISSQTGVTAHTDNDGTMTLTGVDGANIHITEANSGAAKAGLSAGENYGAVTITGQAVGISDATAVSGLNATTDNSYTLSDVDVTSYDAAQLSIQIADQALKEIDKTRSQLGSSQNQLESTIRNISVTQVNVTAAESQIRDVDFAAESANFAKLNILAQSGSYAMSQANAVQQNVLRLLQ